MLILLVLPRLLSSSSAPRRGRLRLLTGLTGEPHGRTTAGDHPEQEPEP